MSHEESTAIPVPDSVSPGIRTASCNLSMATPSPPSGDTLMSLLLQIQQLHSSELHKLQEQVDKWKTKCNKLAMICNDNATVAKKYFKQNKQLKAQVTDLKYQLCVMQSPRQDGISAGARTDDSPPDRVLQREATSHAGITQVEDLPRKTSKQSTKLTSRKSNKKVRYSEIARTEGLPIQAVHTTQVTDSWQQMKPNADISTNRKEEINSLKVLNLKQVTSSSSGGIVLAPDTCISPAPRESSKPTDRMATPATPASRSWRLSGPYVQAVPETLGIEDEIVSSELNAQGSVDAPTYTSTPVGIRSQSQVSPSSDSLQMQNPKVGHIRSSIPQSSVSSKEQAALPSPMPKSESQYPVDLSSTQVKSPTFCGEGLSLTTPGNANDLSRQHGSRTVPFAMEGETSDVSCESEASILLLEPNVQKCFHPNPSHSAEKSKQGQAFRNKEKNSLQQKFPKRLEVNEMAPQTMKTDRHAEGTPISLQSHANLSKLPAPKKRKLDLEDSTCFDETVLPDVASVGKENLLQGEDRNDQISIGASNQHSKPEISKDGKLHTLATEHSGAVDDVRRKKSKSLKQSKLDWNMLKPEMNKSACLMREYNGGSQADVDSQSDAYMIQAIELSLIDQKKAEIKRKDGLGTGLMPSKSVVSVGFKVPTIPNKKQQHCNLDTSLSDAKSLKHPSWQIVAELPESPPESSSSPPDLNGSIDPLMDLTSIERGPSPLNASTADRSYDVQELQSGLLQASCESGSEGDDGDRIQQPQTVDDSLDLFDEKEAYESEENHQFAVGDNVGFTKNFDDVPKVKVKPNYKYTEVVRKHEERQKLRGFGCKECDKFYGGLQLTDAEREERIKICSRHRAQFSPPNTPDHYWSVGFPDTQTCLQRGYIKVSKRSPTRQTRKRKNQKYKKLFTGKEVEDAREGEGDGNE